MKQLRNENKELMRLIKDNERIFNARLREKTKDNEKLNQLFIDL